MYPYCITFYYFCQLFSAPVIKILTFIFDVCYQLFLYYQDKNKNTFREVKNSAVL